MAARLSLKPMIRIAICIGLLLFVGTGFQNCAQQKSFQLTDIDNLGSLNVVAMKNSVYFARADVAGECADTLARAVIEKTEDGKMLLVRDNCAALAAPLRLDPTRLGWMEHNSDALIYNEFLFQKAPLADDDSLAAPQPPYTIDVLCRGELANGSIRQVTDAKIQVDREGQRHVILRIAEYNQGELLALYQTSKLALTHSAEAPDQSLDAAIVATPEKLELQQSLSNGRWSGVLTYSSGVFQGAAPADLIPGQYSITPGMTCFRF